MADPADLVTVATFFQLEEAQVAHGKLEAEEIESFLSGEATMQVMWHLSQAIGGVRLQVAAEDEARAREVLADRTAHDDVEELSAEVPIDAGSEAREKLANRAYRGAIMGLVMCPAFLHVYSLAQVMEFRRGNAPVSARAARRVSIAFAIDVAALAFTALVVVSVNLRGW